MNYFLKTPLGMFLLSAAGSASLQYSAGHFNKKTGLKCSLYNPLGHVTEYCVQYLQSMSATAQCGSAEGAEPPTEKHFRSLPS